jgi:hypothetical protein
MLYVNAQYFKSETFIQNYMRLYIYVLNYLI